MKASGAISMMPFSIRFSTCSGPISSFSAS